MVDQSGEIQPVVPPPTNLPAGSIGGAAGAAAGSGGAEVTAADGGMAMAGTGGSTPPAVPITPPFRWTETIPGAGGCQAATFMGQFSCAVDGIAGQNKFAGTITLLLKGSSETQLFSVDRGQILVFDEDMKLVVSTQMTGLLDCSTQQLVAELVPKSSEMMPLERVANWFSVNQTPMTTGMLKGPLDTSLQVISGDITLVFEPMPKCPGKFTLQSTPRP